MQFGRPITLNLPYGLMSVVARCWLLFITYTSFCFVSPLFLFLSHTYVCSLMSVVLYALLVMSYAWEVQALLNLPIDVLILVW